MVKEEIPYWSDRWNLIFDPWVSPSPNPKAWPWRKKENRVCYVLYQLFVRTKFAMKIFEMDFVIEI